MTKGEIERIAILETLMASLSTEVGSVKSSVATLDGKIDAVLINQAKGNGAWALVSKAMPMLISVGAILIAFASPVK